MGPTACTEPQCLYKGDLYLFFYYNKWIRCAPVCTIICMYKNMYNLYVQISKPKWGKCQELKDTYFSSSYCVSFPFEKYLSWVTGQSCFVFLHSHLNQLQLWNYETIISTRRSQCPRGLRCGCVAASLLGLRVRLPPGTLMPVCYEWCVCVVR
jgi:hypothetical protein